MPQLFYRITKGNNLKDEVYEIDTEIDQVDEVSLFFILFSDKYTSRKN